MQQVDSDDEDSDSDVVPVSRRSTKRRRVEQISQQCKLVFSRPRHRPSPPETYANAEIVYSLQASDSSATNTRQ